MSPGSAAVAMVVAVALAGCAADGEPRRVACSTWKPTASAPGAGELLALIGDDIRYPLDACISGREGVVMVRLVIRRDGSFDQVRLHRSSGDSLLDKEALRAVEAARQRGGRLAFPKEGGERPSVLAEVGISFTTSRW